MLFFLIFSFLLFYYVRLTEWHPGLVGVPVLMIIGVISILYLGFGVISKRFPDVLNGQTEKMMFGFTLAIALSHLCYFYIGGVINSITIFLPTITSFFLVLCFVDSRKRLNVFVTLLILLTTYLAYEGWLQHTTGFSHGGLEPLYEKRMQLEDESIQSSRIRWHGVFNDPNDLGLALVLVIPFLLDMLLQRRFFLPLVTLPLISAAVYFTNSRGTVLAGLVGIASYFVIRYRSLYGALAGGLFALILFMFGPSRMSSVSAAEESAYGRIEAWYAAYQMFKTNPIFGVGHGMFLEHHTLTAHNSFVLVMAELGFIGLFFFTGLFYFPYNWLWCKVLRNESTQLVPKDIRLISASYASLTGMLSSMFFLSRSYILLPFLLVALVTGLTRVIDSEAPITDAATTASPKHLRNILLLTFIQIIGINIIVKLFI